MKEKKDTYQFTIYKSICKPKAKWWSITTFKCTWFPCNSHNLQNYCCRNTTDNPHSHSFEFAPFYELENPASIVYIS